MCTHLTFRTAPSPTDLESVRAIVVSTGFFQSHEVPVAVELVQERIDKGLESGYHFIFADFNGSTISYACFGEIACTKGSWDLYWIATHEQHRGKGVGKNLMAEVEKAIRAMGGRAIYIETSSKPMYEPTRRFYQNYGCTTEAILKDFYDTNDSKYIFRLSL